MDPAGRVEPKDPLSLGARPFAQEAAARCGDDWDAQAICQWVAGKEGPVEEESLRRSFPAALVKQKCKALLEAGVLEKTAGL